MGKLTIIAAITTIALTADAQTMFDFQEPVSEFMVTVEKSGAEWEGMTVNLESMAVSYFEEGFFFLQFVDRTTTYVFAAVIQRYFAFTDVIAQGDRACAALVQEALPGDIIRFCTSPENADQLEGAINRLSDLMLSMRAAR